MAIQDATSAPTDLTWRIVGLVNIYRLLAATVLLAVHWSTQPLATFGEAMPWLFVQTCVVYLSVGSLLAVAGRRHWPNRRLLVLVHTFIDTAAISILLYASGGVASNLAVLLVLPVGGMVLLAEKREPALIAAMATLGVLGQQIMAQLAQIAPISDYPLAGVTGVVIFVLALSVWPVANRLRENEVQMRRQEVDLANLAQLSEYIVQHLRESMLVVDSTDRIRLINESAALMLGEGVAVPGALLGEVSPPLLFRLAAWRRSRRTLRDEENFGPMNSADGSALVQPHIAPLGNTEPATVLIFLEDTGALAAKVQQSKLAALGRLSASIAHEIRNPVGAMSHAAQLLAESPTLGADDRRLAEIMHSNAGRVSNIVDNVLGLSHRAQPRTEVVALATWCERFRAEFCSTLQLPVTAMGVDAPAERVEVLVDPGQLHQIVWNLAQNALVHAGASDAAANAIRLRIGRLTGNARPYLEVCDQGPGIAAEDMERIFEPFFSRGHGGSGLGLFLARELAEINDATLLYRPGEQGGSVFRVVFADPARWHRTVTVGDTGTG
jgi:two-component system sensor histidine kinase PilS (NtrC family)